MVVAIGPHGGKIDRAIWPCYIRQMATAFSLDEFSAAPALQRAHAVVGGLPSDALRELTMISGISLADIAHVVAPRRTLDRRLKEGTDLSLDEGDRLARFVRTLDLVATLFGSRASAMEWLKEPKQRFDGALPLDLLRTDAGTRLVEEVILQAKHGFFA